MVLHLLTATQGWSPFHSTKRKLLSRAGYTPKFLKGHHLGGRAEMEAVEGNPLTSILVEVCRDQ